MVCCLKIRFFYPQFPVKQKKNRKRFQNYYNTTINSGHQPTKISLRQEITKAIAIRRRSKHFKRKLSEGCGKRKTSTKHKLDCNPNHRIMSNLPPENPRSVKHKL